MIRDMTINGYHTRRDLGLVLTTHPVPAQPAPNVYMIDIPGGNGFIDLTQSLTGETTYSSRTGSWAFTMLCEPQNAATQYSNISSKFHGQTCRIVLDDDPNYYYEGLLNVGPLALFGNHGAFNVSYTLYPFKYAATETTETGNLANKTSYAYVMPFVDRSNIKTKTSLYASSGLSVANATGIHIAFPQDGYRDTTSSTATVTFYDSAGHTYSITKSYANIESYNYNIYIAGSTFLTSLASANVDINDITRVYCDHWGGVSITVRETALHVPVEGCDHGISPTITLPNNNMTVVCNGKAFVGLSAGRQVVDGLIIPTGGTDIVFSGSDSGTVTIKYRKEFL